MFEKALAELDVEKFWRDGYAILPDAYSDAEVEQMRAEARHHKQHSKGGDLTSGPLRHTLTDGRMISVARKLLGTEEILYGGDSSATINGKIRVWHKDNTDRLDAAAPDWDSRYTQLRFGIYLQDHTEHTGGLNLKIGAHDICDLSSGQTLYLKNSPRDLLVWSMRMTHSGAGTLLKDPTARFPEPHEWNAFPADEIAPEHEERMAVFAHLGADDKHGRRYLDYLRTRTYMVNGWRANPFTPEILEELQEAGFTVRDMPAEVKDDERAGLFKEWAPYPYPAKGTGDFVIAGRPGKKSAPVTPAPAAAPAAAPAPAAGPQPARVGPTTAERYRAAAKRRLRGVASGARRGWQEAAPKAR
ncbi:hypothetical protein GCM10011492_14680 [Flexivirga endophytica]|uniref:Uncharacterized protein n=1 Tax=Flexivirga endophytica TaxID=1849103 RepID=A0A916T0Z9_9MICO|nr:hypothetical protein [Flexivirga endophytica]GGB25627.1 hypothetical protein GCM10011492_14680 [Flexivirga endophytica]GHB54217.1 hypothetical protein GCM10008112_24000 [Flexivirga endophytica]